MNTENTKKNEPHKFVLNMSQRLDLRSSDKHVAIQKFITRRKISKNSIYKNNKLKIIVPTWNNEFAFPDGSYSVSDTQDYTLKSMKH